MSQPPERLRTSAQVKAWVESLSAEQVSGLAEDMVRGDDDSTPAPGGVTGGDAGRNPDIELREPPERPVLLTVRITLDETDPPVWRRLTIPGDLDLGAVHDVLQQAMGWTDSHLHRFALGDDHDSPYFVTRYDLEEGDQGTLETDARLDQLLRQPGDELVYEYDFGDGWTHTLVLEQVDPMPTDPGPEGGAGPNPAAYPLACLAGERACPPEGVGGIGGYEEVAEWVRGGADPERRLSNELTGREMRDWLPRDWHPDEFDLEEVNAGLARLAPRDVDLAMDELPADLVHLIDRLSAVTRSPLHAWLSAPGWDRPDEFTDAEALGLTTPFRALLDAVDEGVTLTKAGYLPPRLVERIFTEARLAEDWIGKGNREDHTPPVLELREQSRRFGLIRKAKGRLLLTANGRQLREDPQALLDLVLSRLANDGDEFERLAVALRLVAIAGGHPIGERLGLGEGNADLDAIAMMLSVAGWRGSDGGGVDRYAILRTTFPTRNTVRQMVKCADATGTDAAELGRRVARAMLRRMD